LKRCFIRPIRRERKQAQLVSDLGGDRKRPMVVDCPSCKVGIKRSMIQLKRANPVIHTVGYLAEAVGGPDWRKGLKTLLGRVQPRGGPES
jgi:Fe-S oxidoreductase